MAKSYNYDPSAIAEYGKDRMRFELGDIMRWAATEPAQNCTTAARPSPSMTPMYGFRKDGTKLCLTPKFPLVLSLALLA